MNLLLPSFFFCSLLSRQEKQRPLCVYTDLEQGNDVLYRS